MARAVAPVVAGAGAIAAAAFVVAVGPSTVAVDGGAGISTARVTAQRQLWHL